MLGYALGEYLKLTGKVLQDRIAFLLWKRPEVKDSLASSKTEGGC